MDTPSVIKHPGICFLLCGKDIVLPAECPTEFLFVQFLLLRCKLCKKCVVAQRDIEESEITNIFHLEHNSYDTIPVNHLLGYS
jgi:hypothetical protein